MEESQFNQLYQEWSPKLYAYLNKRVHSDFVEDVFQEIWLKIDRIESQYDSRFTRAQWIYTIAQSTMIDFLRKNKKEKLLLNIEDYSDQVLARNEEDYRIIVKDLGLSPEDQKLIIQKIFFEEDFETLALTLKTTAVNLRKRYSRLMERLRKNYEK